MIYFLSSAANEIILLSMLMQLAISSAFMVWFKGSNSILMYVWTLERFFIEILFEIGTDTTLFSQMNSVYFMDIFGYFTVPVHLIMF